MCPREVVEKLRDGQLVIQPKRIGHVADQLMQTLRLDADLNARHLDLAARGPEQACEHLQQRSLPRSVRPDERARLAKADVQTHIAHRRLRVVILRQCKGADHKRP